MPKHAIKPWVCWTSVSIFGSAALGVMIFTGADLRWIPILAGLAALFALPEIVETKQKREVWQVIVLTVCIATVGVMTWRGIVRPSVPTAYAPFLQIAKPEIHGEYSAIAAGRQFGVKISAINPGPHRLLNAYGYSQSYVELVDDHTDEKVRKMFEEAVRSVQSKYQTGKVRGPEMGIGPGIWGSTFTPPLTEHDVDGFFAGTTRIYFVTWLAWIDSDGRRGSSYDCRWLQPFPRRSYSRNDVVWHFCE